MAADSVAAWTLAFALALRLPLAKHAPVPSGRIHVSTRSDEGVLARDRGSCLASTRAT